MKKGKYLPDSIKKLAVLASITALGVGYFASPASAADASATLNVVTLVANTHDGTETPATFLMHVTHNGVEVSGSPVKGHGGSGTVYSLSTGVYNLFQTPSLLKYRGTWSGNITPGGTVTLVAGENITVSRMISDIGTTTTKVVVPPTVPEETTNGGQLPNTSTTWGNSLLVGSTLLMFAAVGFISRKVLAKK